MRHFACATLALPMLLAAAGAQGASSGAEYPVRPMRMVITYPPGGNTDLVGRALAQKLVEAWGQQVVIDNRGGAGGVIGTLIAKQAAPDGYTMLFGTSAGMVLNPLIQPKLAYDPFKDFAPVSLVVIIPQLLMAHPSLPANNVKELIALARAKPGQLNVASSGIGTPNHLGAEMLKAMAGIDIVHVPYKGGGPATTDLIAGQVQLQFTSIPSMMPYIKSGRLKALAVGSATRSAALPDVPTIAESGVPGYEYTTWYGIFAPLGTPAPVIAKLNAGIGQALRSPDLIQRLASQGAEPAPGAPEGLAKHLRNESARWARIIKSAGIRIE